jgi:hypothetical protein
MRNFDLPQFVSIFTNPENNIMGTIKVNDEQTTIEFQAQDLSLEKALMLYSRLGQSLENILSDFFKTKDSKSDNIIQQVNELKAKGMKEEAIIDNIEKSNSGFDVSIIFKVVSEVMKNEQLTKFLTQDIIKNYVLVKLGNNNFIKIDGIVHNFDKPEYRKFLFKLWLQIIIKEMIVFMGGHQS